MAGGGSLGDGGPATSAELSLPVGVAVDAGGNLFIADANAHRIRRVEAGTGIITTVAGTGVAGFSGDGGPATGAQVNSPTGVAVDADGNLFIADADNNLIRRVDRMSGTITTIAGIGLAGFGGDGGHATSARLWSPTGVVVDPAGYLYIADASNNRVRRVEAGTGIITTVAGSGAFGFGGDDGPATDAQLSTPTGVAVDAAGTLFIADANNFRIRRVAADTGTIATVAGTGIPDFGGDGGPATSAELWTPTGVAVDSTGNLYIADANNDRVRRVEAGTGIITTVAGSGVFGFDSDDGLATGAELWVPTGVALDVAGNLFIADQGSFRIRRVAVSSGIFTTVAGTGVDSGGDGGPATSALLRTPTGVAIDTSGNLFITDPENHRVRQVTAGTGIITTVAGIGVAGFSGDLGPATNAELWTPTGVAVDAAGNLFIADADNHRVRRVVAGAGTIVTVAGTGAAGFSGDDGPATSAQLWTPTGVAVDAAGNLFIADAANHRIRRVAADTGIITTVAGGGGGALGDGGLATDAVLNFPYYVALDAAGNLFIADQDNFRIRRVAVSTGTITTVAGTGIAGVSGDGGPARGAQLSVPYGVAVDAAGDLFIADQGNFRIRRVAVDTGTITTIAGTGIEGFSGDGGPATGAQLGVAYGLALDTAGNLFLADSSNTRVRAVDLAVSVLPIVVASAPASSTIATSADFTFVAVEPGLARFSCQLDGGGFTPCASPQSYAGPLAYGEHTFQVMATNQFGNPSAPSTYTWSIFRLMVMKEGTGSGTVTSSPQGISCGETCAANYGGPDDTVVVTLTATPDADSSFIGWSGDGCSGTSPCTVTLGDAIAVVATFNATGPFTFTDQILVGRRSIIKAVHIEELRSAINIVRDARGLGAFAFTDPSLTVGGTTVKAVHITELRIGLNEVYEAVGAPAPTYTDPVLIVAPTGVAPTGVGTTGVESTVVKAVHLRELRSAVQIVPSGPSPPLLLLQGDATGTGDHRL